MKKPKPGQLGPITIYETARAHGLTRDKAEDIAKEAGVAPEPHFGYLTRSQARRFLAEMYRRLGLKVKPGKGRKRRKESE